MAQLCQNLITEILSRLPTNSILRFRCVSRLLCSVIDGGELKKMHLHRSLETCSSETLMVWKDGQVQLVQHRLATRNVRHLTLPLDCKGFLIRLCGSCHGLIAFLDEHRKNIVIWNPHTRKHRIFPGPDVGHKIIFSSLGFGYDSLSNDYKLVFMLDWPQVMVYSLKYNTWRPARGLPYSLSSMAFKDGVLFSEALHFRAIIWGLEFIVAFNLNTEEFRELERLPVHRFAEDIAVLSGQLCAVCKSSTGREMEVWAMKDYGKKGESWTKLLRVSWPQSLCCTPLDYWEEKNKVLLHPRRRSCPKWFDMERKTTTEDVVTAVQEWRLRDPVLTVGSLVDVGGSAAD